VSMPKSRGKTAAELIPTDRRNQGKDAPANFAPAAAPAAPAKLTADDLRKKIQTPERRKKRKIAREVAAMWDDIAREAGYEPIERRTSWAIIVRLYEYDVQPCDTPRRLSLALIGTALTSKSDDKEACEKAARRHGGQLFNHAIPRTGYQMLTRYKAPEESGRSHEYIDHSLPVAEFFSELLSEETERILSSKGLDRKERGVKIAEARARLVANAVGYLPKCEAELVTPEGETYAYVSLPEAEAYCQLKPEFSLRPCTYTPPAEEEEQPQPFYSQDLDRIEERIKATIEKKLDEIFERNSFEEARHFIATRLDKGIPKLLASWVKVAGARSVRQEREEVEEDRKELIHVPDLSGVSPADPVELVPDPDGVPPDKLSPLPSDNFAEDNDLQEPFFETLKNDPDEDHAEIAPESAPALVASINFDTALEAALFYVGEGRPVLPICQYDYETGHCTAEWHDATCTGKRPLVKGKGKPAPGDGYTAATTDLRMIRYWWGKKYPNAGIGIRLDDLAAIDCDLKGGGPESYEFLRDTFDLPETLTQITQSSGLHYVFKLPEDLPADWLKSWTRPLEKIALGGIDLKVGKRGLLYAEPTIGSKGVYRWIDPTVAPATLPRECCDFLHEIRYKDDKPKVDKPKVEKPKAEKTRQTRVYSSSDAPQAPQEIDPDQERYFVDAARGDRHKRLLKIARKIRAIGGDAAQIKKALKYHASRFSEPLSDDPWIERVAAECALKFKPGEASV
jgi:Bifunctional DNA primase/polymerase, N-terminal